MFHCRLRWNDNSANPRRALSGIIAGAIQIASGQSIHYGVYGIWPIETGSPVFVRRICLLISKWWRVLARVSALWEVFLPGACRNREKTGAWEADVGFLLEIKVVITAKGQKEMEEWLIYCNSKVHAPFRSSLMCKHFLKASSEEFG